MDFQNGQNFPQSSLGTLQGMASQLGQLGAQCAPEHPAMQLFREYCEAKVNFDSACHELVRAQQIRAATEQRLNELSKQVDEIVRHGVQDPTVPPTPQPSAKAYRG